MLFRRMRISFSEKIFLEPLNNERVINDEVTMSLFHCEGTKRPKQSLLAYIIAAVVCLSMLNAGMAGAAEVKLIPSATVRQEYNDNVFFSVNDRKSDWITTLSPGITLSGRTERIEVNASARIDDIHYRDERDLNATDQFYQGKLRFRPTMKLSLSGEAAYSRDSRPDRDIETTGLVLNAVKRERQSYGGSGDWRVTERLSTGLSYKYDRDRYDNMGYIDQESQNANLGFYYDLFQKTKGRLIFGYGNYRSPGTVVDTCSGTAGFSTELSEVWSLIVDAGASYTRTQFDVTYLKYVPIYQSSLITIYRPSYVTQEESNSSWGTVGQVALAYKGEKTTGSVVLSKSIAAAAGRTGATDRTSVALDIGHRFTYKFSASVSAMYYLNESDAGQYSPYGIDEKSMRIGAKLKYEFTHDIALEAAYYHYRVEYRNNDTFASRNHIQVAFTIKHAFFE